MKTSFMFHVSVLLMAVLIFSTSFTTLAQQVPPQTQTESAAARDTNTMRLEIKAAAEQDASSDINRFLWFGTGVGITVLSCTTGMIVGLATGSESDYFGYGCIDPNLFGVFGCAVVSLFVPFTAIYNSQPNLSLERLIGKSPEYVKFYTDAYRTKVRSLRTKWAATGTGTGCGIMGGYLILLISQ